jgi:hypothetical protein
VASRLVIGHLRSGDIVADLDATADYTDELAGAGSARAVIPLDTVPREINLRGITAPWRHFLAITRDETVLWAGPIIPRRHPAPGDMVEVTASGIRSVFDRRVLARLGDWDYTDPRADVVLTRRSLAGITVDLVRIALDRPHGDLPIVLPAIDGSGDEQRVYFGHELAMVGQRLTELSDLDTGPDLHFQPRYRPNRSGIEWVLRIGRPHLAQAGASWHFDHGGNLVDYGWDEDGSVLASTVLVPGDGIERGRLIGRAENTALQDIGWPALDTVITDHTSEKQPDVLAGHARAYLDAYRHGITRDTATVHANTTPQLGRYLVGDMCVITPKPDRVTPLGPRHRRITGITYRTSSPDVVELALAPAPTTQS